MNTNEPIIYDLEIRKDVKGGSPKSPPHGVRLDALEARHGDGDGDGDGDGASVWRVITMCLATALFSGIATVFTLGLNNVKSSELESMIVTRSPYTYDKQRIEEHFNTLEKGQAEINKRIEKLETIARDDFDKRIRELETRNGR